MADSSKDGLEGLRKTIETSNDYRHIFNTAEGKRVLHDILDFCGLLSDGFAEDPHVTAYNAGRRSVGVYMLRMLELDQEQLRQMAHEQATGETA